MTVRPERDLLPTKHTVLPSLDLGHAGGFYQHHSTGADFDHVPSSMPHPSSVRKGSPPISTTGAETVSPHRVAIVPRHVAVIVDGNRRWARQHHTDTFTAYRRGGDRVHELLSWCEAAGIEVVTVWPLSIDNLRRDPEEVSTLIRVITEVLDELADAGRWRLNLIGELTRLSQPVRAQLSSAAQRTESVQGIFVNIAVAYNGHDDITAAVRSLLIEHANRGTSVATIAKALTSNQIASHLCTSGQPDVDLIIRTSGEQRLSGFLPWQLAYSELYFCDACWPDFTRTHFNEALQSYTKRSRRHGQ